MTKSFMIHPVQSLFSRVIKRSAFRSRQTKFLKQR